MKINLLTFGMMDKDNIIVAVKSSDCPYPKGKQVHTNYDSNKDLVWSCHCYDTDKDLPPIVGSNAEKCEYFVRANLVEGVVCSFNK